MPTQPIINLYLDTNLFIYLADPKSQFYRPCKSFINYCQKNSIQLSTSTETIQEIIYLAQNLKQIDNGLKTALATLKLINNLYPISELTIKIYLDQVNLHKSSISRDILHLSSCLENNINHIITYDQDFKKFKQITSLKPEEVLV